MAKIHPTAIVDPKAELDASVTVGAYTLVGPDVKIAAGTTVAANAATGWDRRNRSAAAPATSRPYPTGPSVRASASNAEPTVKPAATRTGSPASAIEGSEMRDIRWDAIHRNVMQEKRSVIRPRMYPRLLRRAQPSANWPKKRKNERQPMRVRQQRSSLTPWLVRRA